MTAASAAGFSKGNPLNAPAYDSIFKEFYLPAVRDLLNRKRILSRVVQRYTEVVEGKYSVIALNTGGNTSNGYIAELGTLPSPGAQTYNQARYNMRYGYSRIKFSGPAASAARSDRGAFLRIMDAEIRGAARDAQHFANRIMFGNGTGRLFALTSTAGAPTYTVQDPGGITSAASGTQYAEVGMRVAFVDNEADVITSGTLSLLPGAVSTNLAYTIDAIDHAAGTVTLNENIGGTPDAGDFAYIASDLTTTLTWRDIGRANEPFGLEAIIDDGNPPLYDVAHGFPAGSVGLGEIDASTEPTWRSFVLDNGGTLIPFSQDMFQQAMDGVDILGDGVVQMWMTTHGIRRQYVNSLVGAKRYPNTMELDGGFKAITYDDRPVVVDKDCPRGRVYGIDTDALYIFSETDWDWIDQDGSVLHRIPDQDAFQAALYRYWEFGTDARNRLCKITDILDA